MIGYCRFQRDRPQRRVQHYQAHNATLEATSVLVPAPTEEDCALSADARSWMEEVGPEHDLELMNLFVLPEFQGRGVGKELLQRARQQAMADFGARSALVWCVDNEHARQFYLRQGAALVGRYRATDGKNDLRTIFSLQLDSDPAVLADSAS